MMTGNRLIFLPNKLKLEVQAKLALTAIIIRIILQLIMKKSKRNLDPAHLPLDTQVEEVDIITKERDQTVILKAATLMRMITRIALLQMMEMVKAAVAENTIIITIIIEEEREEIAEVAMIKENQDLKCPLLMHLLFLTRHLLKCKEIL